MIRQFLTRCLLRRLEGGLDPDTFESLEGDLHEQHGARLPLLRLAGITLSVELSRLHGRVGSLHTGARSMLNRGVVHDIRAAARGLRHAPGLTIVAIITLGLGVGAATTLFSVTDTILWRPLPYPDSHRLVELGSTPLEARYAGSVFSISPRLFIDWKENLEAFEHVSGRINVEFDLTGAGEPQTVLGAAVSQSMAELLGMRFHLGRWFTPDEDSEASALVAVVSFSLWQNQLEGDRDLVGRTITLNGEPVTVVGVLDRDFRGPEAVSLDDTNIYIPIRQSGRDLNEIGNWYVTVLARIAEGMEFTTAYEQLMATTEGILADYSEGQSIVPAMRTLKDLTVGDIAPTVLLLLGASGLLVIIACVNVAHIVMTRSNSRRRELAIRSALGADRIRILRLLLTENLMLAALGATLAVALSFGGVSLFRVYEPGLLPRTGEIGIDLRVLIFSALLAAATGILFGGAPALLESRRDPIEGLKTGGRTGSDRSGSRIRAMLVSVESGMAVVVVVATALLMNSFVRLMNVDPGFDTNNRLELSIVTSSQYRGRDAYAAYHARISERLKAVPGAITVGLTNGRPYGGAVAAGSYVIEGKDPVENDYLPWQLIDDGYFAAMGTELTAGRNVSAAEVADRAPVVLVNERMQREYFDGDAIGKRLKIIDDSEEAPWLTVIGVVEDVRPGRLSRTSAPHVFVPYTVPRFLFPPVSFVIHSRLPVDQMASAVKAALWEVDPLQPIETLTSLDNQVTESLDQPKFFLVLIGGFGLVALVLTTAGTYGTVAFNVSQKKREMGIMLALGAGRTRVRRAVLVTGVAPVIAGSLAGLGVAALLSRFIESLVYEITPVDATTYAVSGLFLVLIALTACLIPAARAASVDPVETLKIE